MMRNSSTQTPSVFWQKWDTGTGFCVASKQYGNNNTSVKTVRDGEPIQLSPKWQTFLRLYKPPFWAGHSENWPPHREKVGHSVQMLNNTLRSYWAAWPYGCKYIPHGLQQICLTQRKTLRTPVGISKQERQSYTVLSRPWHLMCRSSWLTHRSTLCSVLHLPHILVGAGNEKSNPSRWPSTLL